MWQCWCTFKLLLWSEKSQLTFLIYDLFSLNASRGRHLLTLSSAHCVNFVSKSVRGAYACSFSPSFVKTLHKPTADVTVTTSLFFPLNSSSEGLSCTHSCSEGFTLYFDSVSWLQATLQSLICSTSDSCCFSTVQTYIIKTPAYPLRRWEAKGGDMNV